MLDYELLCHFVTCNMQIVITRSKVLWQSCSSIQNFWQCKISIAKRLSRGALGTKTFTGELL